MAFAMALSTPDNGGMREANNSEGIRETNNSEGIREVNNSEGIRETNNSEGMRESNNSGMREPNNSDGMLLRRRAGDIFAAMDGDGDGFLTPKELKAGIFAICGERLSKQDILLHVHDKTPGISFEQFVNISNSRLLTTSNDNAIFTAFKCFDKSRKGFITPQDARNVFGMLFKQMPIETIDQIFEELDESSRGEIDFERFNQIMTTRSSLFVL